MSQTTTQKLGLTKDDGNEAFLDLRPHVNANMETIDDFAGDISDSIANFETNPATSNHSAGTYFMLENTLHRAKTAIASGESITSSNAEPITIAQVLNTLNSNVSALQDSVSGVYAHRYDIPDTSAPKEVTIKSAISYQGYLIMTQRLGLFVVWNINGTLDVERVGRDLTSLSFSAVGTRDIKLTWNNAANLWMVVISYAQFSMS